MRLVTQDWTEILSAANASHMRESRGLISLFDSREGFENDKWEYDVRDKLGFEWQYLSPAELKIMVPEVRLDKGVALFYPDWQHMLDPGIVTAMIAEDSFKEN